MNSVFEQIVKVIIHIKDERYVKGTQIVPRAYKGYNISNYPVATALKGELQ